MFPNAEESIDYMDVCTSGCDDFGEACDTCTSATCTLCDSRWYVGSNGICERKYIQVQRGLIQLEQCYFVQY